MLEGFSILLEVGITTGVVLSSPFWLHQLWAFITPGLRRKERRFGVAFVCFGSLLFLLGAVVAYLLLPEVLRVVTSIAGSDNLLTAFSAGDYVSFLINLLVVFGISFELPLVVVMLNFAGILRYQKVRRWRRGFFFGIVIFAALVTPGTDAISMVILAGALSLLFELALQVARLHDKRLEARRKAEGWDTDDPDTASELQHAPEPVLPEDRGATVEPGRPGGLAERPSASAGEPFTGRSWDEDAT